MADEGGPYRFAHHRLDVYAVAVELVVSTRRLMAGVPRGHRSLTDHALRASASTVLLIAEGANRRSPGDKRQRYSIARGECGEVAAAVEIAVALGFVRTSDAAEVLALAARICAMLLRLEQQLVESMGGIALMLSTAMIQFVFRGGAVPADRDQSSIQMGASPVFMGSAKDHRGRPKGSVQAPLTQSGSPATRQS